MVWREKPGRGRMLGATKGKREWEARGPRWGQVGAGDSLTWWWRNWLGWLLAFLTFTIYRGPVLL